MRWVGNITYGGGEGYMKDNVYQYFESHATHSLRQISYLATSFNLTFRSSLSQ